MPILMFISLFTLLDFVLLFSIGSQIGLLATLLLVLGTGVIGLQLIRQEGISTLARARQRMQKGEIPSNELFTGAALIFGGALLMAPGFLSDALGLACLLPSARQLLMKVLTAALTWFGLKTAQHAPNDSEATHPHQRQQQDQRAESKSSDAPLEGDFISRDDTSYRH